MRDKPGERPEGSDQGKITYDTRIEATVVIKFNEFTPLNDALVDWMASYLRGRVEVKSVEYTTVGLNQDSVEDSDGKQPSDSGAPGEANAQGNI